MLLGGSQSHTRSYWDFTGKQLPTVPSPSSTTAFQGSFRPGRSHNQDPLRGPTPGLRLNVCCHINPRTLSSRAKGSGSVSASGQRRKSVELPGKILQRLDSNEDLDDTLYTLCKNLSPKLQTLVLNKQQRWDRVVQIFEFFKAQPGYVPNAIHYNVVLRALGKARRWNKLRLCWIEMAEEGLVGASTYGILVDLYGKAGLFKEALRVIKHMRLGGIFPDEATMISVLKVLKDAGEYDKAVTFFENWCIGWVDLDGLELDYMEDSLDSSSSSATSIKQLLSTELFEILPMPRLGGLSDPDERQTRKPRLTATYNSMIDLYAKAGRMKDAVGLFREMSEAGVEMDTVTLNTLIFACGTLGSLEDAELLIEEMKDKGISPNTKTYNTLLSLYAKTDNVGAACRCYQMIKEAGLLPDSVTYRAILQMLCERKMVREAEAVIEDMEKSSGCIEIYSIPRIVEMYLDAGLLEKANWFLSKCNVSDGEFHPKMRASIIDAFAARGLWAEAETVFYSITALVRKRSSWEYNAMIKAYGKAKLYDKAYSLFTGMRNHGTRPDACTYNTLIEMFSDGDIADQARILLVEMQEAGFTPDSLAFSCLISSYIRDGQLSSARLVCQEMGRIGLEPDKDLLDSLIDRT